MTIELIKQLLDACYLAKRAREMLPALPEGVTSSYIQCLDVIQKLQTRGIWPKISDLSDALNLPRPGVTRTVKEMEHKGYTLYKYLKSISTDEEYAEIASRILDEWLSESDGS